jgi:sugar/nucleoside kinase (ribokinase family)
VSGFSYVSIGIKPLYSKEFIMIPEPAAAILGNVAFDIICYPVDDVPRSSSMTFEKAVISPGGCGSNSAIGLAALGIPTALIACIGDDIPGLLAMQYWHEFGVDTRFIHKLPASTTGVSVGLVDHEAQPRFVHTTGANQFLNVSSIPVETLLNANLRAFHIAGYFLMPGLLEPELAAKLAQLQAAGVFVTLDVQQTPRMSQPEMLWTILPILDAFLCNANEAALITGAAAPAEAVKVFLEHGAKHVIIKLGERGCLLASEQINRTIPAPLVNVVDTTGAGDAFAAGLIYSIIHGAELVEACEFANQVGAKMVTTLGAVEAWRD